MDTFAGTLNSRLQPGGFNGAMTSQPWIPVATTPAPMEHFSFNGAMTSQPWIPDLPAGGIAGLASLQWSHDLSAMDTWLSQVGMSHSERGASMEP